MLKVRPLLAVIVRSPLDTRALSIFIVEPVEVITKFPAEAVLLALSVNAFVELKVTPSFNVNTEEFALILRLPEAVEIPRRALREGDRVLVINDDLELNYRDVDVIKRTRDGFLLGGGLQNGERICISPIEAVTDGMKVRVAPAS